ncbi:gluconate 2-dehydrogenase subunit 3 family protein [Opitutaceae bacterium]|nr:gluconate 2-dehydrogenase subunit 3 family protein [Opitutaceae bacterium]
MNFDHRPARISRREVIKWFTTAAAAAQLGPNSIWGAEDGALPPGYGSDPKVAAIYERGDVWPLTLDDSQRRLVTFLADLILPKDEYGPAASALRVPDFIDEWVSAPYPKQRATRKRILPGLEFMDKLSEKKFGRKFTELSPAQGTAILDATMGQSGGDDLAQNAASFLHDFTSLCMGAYYGTPAGWKAIGYVGNMPLPSFDGPPQHVLDRVGVVQTVK